VCACLHKNRGDNYTHEYQERETSEKKREGACVDREILEDQDVLVVFSLLLKGYLLLSLSNSSLSF